MLSSMPYALAEKALCKVLMTACFWPTVAEIREAVDSLRPGQKIIRRLMTPERRFAEN